MLAEYSATGTPRSAGASSTTPRATPSLNVEAGVLVHESLLDRGLIRTEAPEYVTELPEQRNEPFGQRTVDRRMNDPIGHMAEPIRGNVDDPPPGMPQAGIEPKNPHSPSQRRPIQYAAPRRDQALSRASTSSPTSKLA